MEVSHSPSTDERPDFWQRLLHRWFVQYNPIYLLSAMLVLGGVILVSRGLAEDGSVYGSLGVALIAEVYACALIGCAALLIRVDQRRPAVLLGLLTVLYQADLTLHTETCVYLGVAGAVATTLWLGLFLAKLFALAWALRLNLGWRAAATAGLGAAGLVVGPYVLPGLGETRAGLLLALFVIALDALCPSTDQSATSRRPLDAWGQTVLRRCVRTTWILWSLALGTHFVFWSAQRPISLGFVVLAVAFLALCRLPGERWFWVGVAGLPALALFVAPTLLSLCALFAALMLIRRAFRASPGFVVSADVPLGSPYRAADPDTAVGALRIAVTRLVPPEAVRARLLSGALGALYVSAWTAGYRGGIWPPHSLVLDATLAAGAGFAMWRLRSRVPLVPLAAAYAHALASSGLVPQPRSLLGWGVTALALGFLSLFGSVAVSYRLRRFR